MSGPLVAAGLRAAVVIVGFAAYALSIPSRCHGEAVVGFDAPLGDERRPEAMALAASRIRSQVLSLAGGSELRVEPAARDALRFIVEDVDGQKAVAICQRIIAAVVARSAELLSPAVYDPTDPERALARYVASHPELDGALTPRLQRPQRTELERTRLQIERGRVQSELDRTSARTDGETDNPFEQRAVADRTLLRRRLAEIDSLLSAPARPETPPSSIAPEFTALVDAARRAARSSPPPAALRAHVLSPAAVRAMPPLQDGKIFLYLGLGAVLLAGFLPLLFSSEAPKAVALASAGASTEVASEPLALSASSMPPSARYEVSPIASGRSTPQSSNPPPRDPSTRSSNPPPLDPASQSSNPPPRGPATRSSNPPPRDPATRSSSPPPRDPPTRSSSPPPRQDSGRQFTTSRPASSSPVWAYPVAWQADAGVVPEEHAMLVAKLKACAGRECFVVAVVASASLGEQKSVLAASVALALAAEEEARVLLLEGEFAKPSVHRILHLDSPANTDLTSQLNARVGQTQEGSWYVVKCSASLHVLPCLQAAPELLLSTHFETCVQQLREFYDFIVINGPSVEDRVGCRAVDDVSQGVIVASRERELDTPSSAFSEKRFRSIVHVA